MTIDSVHPLFTYYSDSQQLCRDFNEGEAHVKSKGETYLKATPGMILDGMNEGQEGKKAYDRYVYRAVFHEHVKAAVVIALGLLHQKDAVFNLPPQLEYLRTRATNKGEGLQELLINITTEQLITGRAGILADIPRNPQVIPQPYIALYKAESIINWDESNDFVDTDQVNMVVLNESGYRRDGFNWTVEKQYRVLKLENGIYYQALYTQETGFDDEPSSYIIPQIRSTPLNEIPFIFINAITILPHPEQPPLLELANKTWAIYRAEADYRQSLFMQGQDTLVVIGSVRNPNKQPGGDNTLRVGAGARIDIDVTGDAKYIGVSSKGLSEQRTTIENDDKKADLISGRFIGAQSNVESGKSLTVRLGAQTASLNTIAKSSCAALEKLLKTIAVWIGANPDEVQIIPNLDFTKVEFQGIELVNLMTARNMGAPLSLEAMHMGMVDRGLSNFSFEEEKAKIKAENEEMNIPEPDAKIKASQANQPNRLPSSVENMTMPKG